jgi:hypothetical protein
VAPQETSPNELAFSSSGSTAEDKVITPDPADHRHNYDPADTGKDRRYLMLGTLIVSVLAVGILCYVTFGESI